MANRLTLAGIRVNVGCEDAGLDVRRSLGTGGKAEVSVTNGVSSMGVLLGPDDLEALGQRCIETARKIRSEGGRS